MTDPTPYVQAAAEAARRGGAELVARLRGERQIEAKASSIDLVTDADKASEKAILAFLRERFPGHAILSEETGASAGGAGLRWIVDPLDGTTNYAHRVPHFCVSVGLEDGEGLLAGAVLDPLRGELFCAGRGRGATLNGEPIRASGEADLGRALLSTGFPYDVWQKHQRPLALFEGFLKRAQGLRRAGSAALDLCYVAAGRYDGFFEVTLKPWDLAAGALLVREAGGQVTDLIGGRLDLAQGDVLASNRRLHSEMTALSRQLLSAL
jgi:myo-inositol-1(or 4)-monophosphatase